MNEQELLGPRAHGAACGQAVLKSTAEDFQVDEVLDIDQDALGLQARDDLGRRFCRDDHAGECFCIDFLVAQLVEGGHVPYDRETESRLHWGGKGYTPDEEGTLIDDENAPLAATVCALTVVDPDTPTPSVVITVLAQDVPGAFTVVGSVLRVASASLDFERKASYWVTVRATDAGDATSFADTRVTVTLNDVNEAPIVAELERDYRAKGLLVVGPAEFLAITR